MFNSSRPHNAVVRRIVVGALMVGLAGAVAACSSDSDAAGFTSIPVATRPSSETASTTPEITLQASPPVVTYPPPFIDHVQWVRSAVGPSLQVYPTTSGRRSTEPSAMDAAWAEVVGKYASADTPGMRAQFNCHWEFARVIDPDKPSWNLEPGRPVVDENIMISTRCNPGLAEE